MPSIGARPAGEGDMAGKGGKRREGAHRSEMLSRRQVPMNLALTAMVTLCPAEMAGCFDRCGHVKACANLEFQK